MRKRTAILSVFCVLAVVGTSGCDKIMGLIRANREAVKWEGPIKEIAYENITKDDKTFTIEMRSRVDAPIDQVWAVLKTPETLADHSDQYKMSKLLKHEGNTKELQLHVMALGNMQDFKMRLTFDDAKHLVTLKTLESTLANIDGTYQLKPSPDGKKTLYIYKAKQTDKVALPLSVDVQRSAIKESFVNQVRAMKDQLPKAS